MVQKLISPSKHAGSDPETFRLRPVMAITASVQTQSGRIVHAGSDFPQPFQFRFSKEGMDHIVQKQQQQKTNNNNKKPESELDGLVRVWPNASGLEASQMHLVCKNPPARFWPMLLSQSGPDANRIRHVYCRGSLHVTAVKKRYRCTRP